MCSVIIINKLLMVLINFRRILRKEYLKFKYFNSISLLQNSFQMCYRSPKTY